MSDDQKPTAATKEEATKPKTRKPRVRISFQEEAIPQRILSYPDHEGGILSSHDADDDGDDDDDDDDEEMIVDHQPFTSRTTTSVKSALSSSSKLSRKKRNKKKALTWDEDAIEEHDLLRGTRMKIDEPDTPFNYVDHQSDDDASVARSVSSATGDSNNNHQQPSSLADNWNRLERSCAAVAAIRGRSHSPSGSMSSSHYASDSSHDGKSLSSAGSGGPRMAKERVKMKEVEFKMNRKAHYNEMEELRKWKMEHGDDDDDDEDMET